MFNWRGIWLPDGERHLPEWMLAADQKRGGLPQYQFHKYKAARRWLKQGRWLAVDVGAHVGQWSRNMAQDFVGVVAFEPVPTYAECWLRNLSTYDNATLHPVALGAEEGRVSLRAGTPGSYGDTFVTTNGVEANAAQDVKQTTLDSFKLEGVDFLKVDCEGYEFFVIQGGEETIRRDKPCVIVEQKPGMAQKYGLKETQAVELLCSWGARFREEISGDYILTW